ncbi:Dam family site-specific DNA-(adenine-N6)-methyltransferase [Empedobacter falsenii]
MKNNFNKSPLNYIGGKYKILPQILPLFPKEIDVFVDLFAGGCNVGINVNSKKTVFIDNLTYLIDMYKSFNDLDINEILLHIDNRIKDFELSITNVDGYNKFRDYYNSEQSHPLDLFVLIAYSFNHQIRFNNSHKYNNPFGKDRSSFNINMRNNLIKFLNVIKSKNIEFINCDFTAYNFDKLNSNDFVYCDPPYLITTGSYNDGKRGFKGWTTKEELELLAKLDELNSRNIKFALSNVIDHKGKSNDILKDWLLKNNYNINFIDTNYSNSNYQTIIRDTKASIEVLITNYEVDNQPNQLNLF